MTRDRETSAHRAAPWLRVGARALIVAGVAGAAWLFGSAVAHAAERDPGLLGLVDSVTETTVAPVLTDTHRVVARVVPAATHGAKRAVGATQALARTVVAPLGGSTPLDVLRPALSGDDSVLRPVVGLLEPVTTTVTGDAAAPISQVVGPSTNPVAAAPAGTDGAKDPHPVRVRDTGGEEWSGPATTPAANRTAEPVSTGAGAAQPGHRTPAHGVAATGTETGPALRRTVRDGGTNEVQPFAPNSPPAGPGLGSSGGVPTGVSGSAQDAGASAYVQGSAGAGAAAVRRAFRAAEVEVRRLIAEPPTFSPD